MRKTIPFNLLAVKSLDARPALVSSQNNHRKAGADNFSAGAGVFLNQPDKLMRFFQNISHFFVNVFYLNNERLIAVAGKKSVGFFIAHPATAISRSLLR